MKLETKFRGKCLDKWIIGDLIFIDKKPFIYLDEMARTFVGKFFPVHKDSVGQFTGLKDKNGKEIYDGDICSGLFNGESLIATIIFRKGAYCIQSEIDSYTLFECISKNDMLKYVEVLGNKYETPDLLKV